MHRTIGRSVALAGAAALLLAGCSSSSRTDTASSGEASGGATGSCEADGILKIGNILPQTGNLAFLGPPEFAGVELAVKQINDAHGHLFGAYTIQQAGRLIAEVVGGAGRACCFGGDEFTVFLPGMDKSEACRVAERIRSGLGDSSC